MDWVGSYNIEKIKRLADKILETFENEKIEVLNSETIKRFTNNKDLILFSKKEFRPLIPASLIFQNILFQFPLCYPKSKDFSLRLALLFVDSVKKKKITTSCHSNPHAIPLHTNSIALIEDIKYNTEHGLFQTDLLVLSGPHAGDRFKYGLNEYIFCYVLPMLGVRHHDNLKLAVDFLLPIEITQDGRCKITRILVSKDVIRRVRSLNNQVVKEKSHVAIKTYWK